MQDKQLEAALGLLKNKDYNNAYSVLFKHLKENPGNESTLCHLALFAIVTGSEDVSNFYIGKVGKDTFSQFLQEQMDDNIIELLFNNQKEHKKWANYRRSRNQNEINRFGVTAPLCTGDVLEVGCANGNLSGVIGMNADRLFGLDIDPVAIELARYNMHKLQLSNCYFSLGDGANLSYDDNSFDTVLLAEVLEHVPDPYPFVREAYRVCRPGGKVLISVPKGYNIPDPDHVRIFTKDILTEIVQLVTGENIDWIEEVPGPWLFGSIEVKKKNECHNMVRITDFLPVHALPDLNTDEMVTIIIPTYNRAEYLKESLDSVLQQSYPNKEIIVIDDGSTDKTKELLSNYNQVIYFRKENEGKSSAINMALKHATGKYIWIFDDDDIALPKKLEVQIREFQRDSSIDIVHTSAIFMHEKEGRKVYTGMQQAEKIPQSELLLEQLKWNHLFTPSVVVKKEVYERTGEWDISMTRAQDYDMWTRACKHSNVGHLPLPTLFYRFHSGTRGTKSETILAEELRSSTEKYHRMVVKKMHNMPIDEIFRSDKQISIAFQVESLLERAVHMEVNQLLKQCMHDISEAKSIARDSGEKYLNLSAKGIQLVKILDEKMREWGESQGIIDILFFVKMINRANM
ncbi:glycosyltransferase [Terribacillus sp. AE2B 122]|uniref:glycosyltransferase n=1 Tax=Terribacillus sp. AE2B 122 TaxID=1331902 RepID=UPI001582056E|nr:glycosyltransferase [Terribacillus sp. AE2B 122]